MEEGAEIGEELYMNQIFLIVEIFSSHLIGGLQTLWQGVNYKRYNNLEGSFQSKN